MENTIVCLLTIIAVSDIFIVFSLAKILDVVSDKLSKQSILNVLFSENIKNIFKQINGDKNEK